MAHLIELQAVRTYATRENAIKAVEKKLPPEILPTLRYFIHQDGNGRFFPVFIGAEAVREGIHFHFNIVA